MKAITKANETVKTLDRTIEGVAQVGIGLGVTFAGLTGLWATACIISAVATSGGLLELGRMWITAVTGV